MGGSFGICCKTCDYEKFFTTGIGMMYSKRNLGSADSDLLPSLFRSKNMVAHIRKLILEDNAEIADDYGHDVYQCSKCNEFYNRFYIHLDFAGGSFEPTYKCPKCKKMLERFDLHVQNPLKDLPCPQCNNQTLQENAELMILWD